MQESTSNNVVIAGGSGFLGRGLARDLLQRGDRVTILSRSPLPPGDWPEDLADSIDWVQWDARSLGDWSRCLDGATALVNLVGRTVDCRKTPENKRDILESRVDSCRVLGEALRTATNPPRVWIQSATAHIVGDPEPRDTICDESTPHGPLHELAPFVGVKWEEAFNAARLPDQRGVIMRISFVLGPYGGPFQRLSQLTRCFLGGTVGSGTQWISWIHQHDLNRLIVNAIDDDSYAGTYMVTAPEPVANRCFMRALRQAYHRPWSPPAPAVGVRLVSRYVLRTDPELALLGRRCVPRRLLNEHRFEFRYPTLDEALRNLRAIEQESPNKSHSM